MVGPQDRQDDKVIQLCDGRVLDLSRLLSAFGLRGEVVIEWMQC